MEAGSESPFGAAETITTTKLSQEELGAQKPKFNYSAGGEKPTLDEPLEPLNFPLTC